MWFGFKSKRSGLDELLGSLRKTFDKDKDGEEEGEKEKSAADSLLIQSSDTPARS